MLLQSCFQREKDFLPLIEALKKEKKPVLVTGIASSLKELFPGAVIGAAGERALILLPHEKEASSLQKALSSVFPGCYFFPPRDFSLVRVDSASRDFSTQRLRVLKKVAEGDFTCVVTTLEAACQATLPPEIMTRFSTKFSIGDSFTKEEILSLFLEAGYLPTERVEGPGQYAARGDIIDVFLPSQDAPCRIELFGDEIDAMGYFDPVTQRRIENLSSFLLCPAEEICFSGKDREIIAQFLEEEESSLSPQDQEKHLFIRDLKERMKNGLDFARDLFLPLVYRFATLLDYFQDELIFLSQQSDGRESLGAALSLLREELKSLYEQNKAVLPGDKLCLLEDFDTLCQRLQNRRVLLIENFFAGKSAIAPCGIFSFRTRTLPARSREVSALTQEVRALMEEGYRVVLLCENSMAAENLHSFFTESKMPARLLTGNEELFPEDAISLLSRSSAGADLIGGGFALSDSRLALLTDHPSGKTKEKKRRVSPFKKSAQEKLLSYTDLAPGDYVVHQSHGIGIFRGVEKMKGADGCLKDFIKISYAASDVLYVPCSNLDAVSKYIGPKSDSATLKLNKLGGAEWKKTTARAKMSAKNIAKDLIALYAQRQRLPGFAFSPDTTWQKEFEDAFPYGETDGQLQAADQIKADMEKAVPMDRLLCGDVGFGKTEVALRGVFKCVMDNKQAAILVPTTILAWQHYQTLLARFKGYPVNIEMLSRFRTKKEQTKILHALEKGEIDILVGTHRLLQEDVRFSDLGLLVIDEEQRFGVSHKERLKEMSRGVDVLTLTATPIPRTLNMALGGLRDMSLLEEAPEDRFPVQTYVLQHDRALLWEAIRRELRRGGQVFYLNNNINELQALLPQLQREFPDAQCALAHGKLDKDSLSDIWKAMMDREIDILLCTTIIETGVDLPDANTLIVENADRFGLSQLHQIRGRVGRSDRKAYAYLTYRPGKVLSEISVKRLEAIREYTQFGSGFQIALRDLEIRGAGNLLGAEQSGHLDSVGFDLYMKILSDAVLEEKGQPPTQKTECVVDLALDGFIPESYVPYPSQRMDLYRKIAALESKEEAEDLTDELMDRFGTVPRSVDNLFQISLLRNLAEKNLCEKIQQRGKDLIFSFAQAREGAWLLLSAVYASRLTLSLTGKPSLTLTLEGKAGALEQAKELLVHLQAFSEETKEQTQNLSEPPERKNPS